MRILHAIRSDGFAGVERHVARLARAQAARGDQVVVVGGDPAAMRATLADPRVTHVPARTTLDVVRALRSHAPGAAVLHTHMTAAEVAATFAGSIGRDLPPVVTTRHFASTRGSGRAGALKAAVGRHRVRAQIAISEHVARHVDGPSVVVRPGVEDRPDGADAAGRKPVVLMVQRLEAEKRTDLGLRAFAASNLSAQGWQLHVAGDGARRAELERLTAELGIATAVTFLGTRTDVEELMASASLLLAPCPVEGLGLTVLEAMASGLPVVAAGAGGHHEMLDGLEPLALYPPYEPEVAGKQLAELAASPGRRDAYARAARAVQRERFTPQAQAAATALVYERVLGETHDPGGSRAGARASSTRDLVVVSLEAWDDVWRRNQYLVAELARADPGLRVLFVEPAADPLHQLSRRAVPRPGRGLRPLEAGTGSVEGVAAGQVWLYQPTKVLPRRIDRRADDRLAAQVRRAVHRRGFRAPVLWINDPSAARLLERTRWPSLYDVTDDWLAAQRGTEEKRRLAKDESVLLTRADEVVVCSPDLVRSKGAHREVTLVTNGVDVERYRTPAPRPDDLPDGPVALYVGTVHPDRFDVDLTVATAEHLAGHATLVLVGPVVDLDDGQLDALRRAGVVRLGRRAHTLVPAYLQHAAVLLVPHVVDEFTDSLDPIKLYEYRAVGRPVVATRVAGFREGTDDRVVSVGSADFPAAALTAVRRSADGAAPGPEVDAADGTADDIPTWRGQAAVMADVVGRARRRAATRP
ncbi:glycosyltransferase family 4 protein [Oerskovia flava]|uniref:glycosyltransferase family 4 protein n=1 Tax=Oerskovia flava TaxID=2986422 RepID=UPI00223FF49F|nr:glycosyltransferase [Oerskovia sp. JB1-3-2]